VRPDGSKELIAVEDGYRESTESWLSVLRDLDRRGMRAPVLAVGDGALGFWAAVREVCSRLLALCPSVLCGAKLLGEGSEARFVEATNRSFNVGWWRTHNIKVAIPNNLAPLVCRLHADGRDVVLNGQWARDD